MQPRDDNVIAVVPVELLVNYRDDEIKRLERLDQQYEDGLVTLEEALRIMEGRQVWQ